MHGSLIGLPFGQGTTDTLAGSACFNRLASFCSKSFLREFVASHVCIKTGFALSPAEYNNQAAATHRKQCVRRSGSYLMHQGMARRPPRRSAFHLIHKGIARRPDRNASSASAAAVHT